MWHSFAVLSSVAIVLLVSSQYAHAQTFSDCRSLPDAAALEELIRLTFRVGDSPPSGVVIDVQDFNYVCLVSGMFRGTYRKLSVVVSYDCSGSTLCPSASPMSQFDFTCNSDEEWIDEVLGTNEFSRTDVANADLTTPNRTNCSICISPNHPSQPGIPLPYDMITHCIACDAQCLAQGDMRCFGPDPDECCSFYDPHNGGKCLNECSSARMITDIFDCAVVTVSFDEPSYTVLESESVEITLSLDKGIATAFSVDVRPEPTVQPPGLEPSIPTVTYTVNFPVSDSPQSQTFTLTPVDDNVPNEPNEVIDLVFASISDPRVVQGDPAQVIIDDDILENIGFAVPSYTFIENEGTGSVIVNGPANFPSTLSVRIMGGPGTQPPTVRISGTDVDEILISFPATVTFTINDDDAALEDIEMYTLVLIPSDPSITISQNTSRIFILDDDDLTIPPPLQSTSVLGDRDNNCTCSESCSSAVIAVSAVSLLLIVTLTTVILTQCLLMIRMKKSKDVLHKNETYAEDMTSTTVNLDVPVTPNEAYAMHKVTSSTKEVTYELVK